MDSPVIHVIAGAPGAGKTSVGGAMLHALGLDYFDPEAFARAALEAGEADIRDALAMGWRESVRRLQVAITERRPHVFETTLAGSTIPALLRLAADRGMRVRAWYFGLEDPELQVYRARRRAEHGGFPRSEADVRRAWQRSMEGLVYLLPYLDALRLFDNSSARETGAPIVPEPRELMRMGTGVPSWTVPDALTIPDWAKPVFEAAVAAAPMRPIDASSRTRPRREGRSARRASGTPAA